MAISSWEPGVGQKEPEPELTHQQLERFASLAAQDQLQDLAGSLSEEERSLGSVMRWDASRWATHLEGLEHGTLLDLIRFFTCAEMQLPGWEAGDKSPVIVINKQLKQQGVKLDKALLQWIRAQSTNRFIPNGALL